MPPHHVFTTALLCAAALSLPAAARADWSQYIADSGMPGLDALDSVISNLKQPALSAPALPYISNLLQLGDYAAETFNRAVTSGETIGQAAVEQGVIDGSGFAVSYSLNSLLAGCFASTACVISSAGGFVSLGTLTAVAGIGIDAALVSKAVEADIDYQHEQQQLAASLRQVQQLQQRVDQENTLKQQLLAQRSTPQWQSQRSAQIAQATSAAPKTSTIVTIIAGTPRPTASATSQGNQPATGNPTEIGVGPAKQINTAGGPALIGEPGNIGPTGATAATVGTPTDIAKPVAIGTATGAQTGIPTGGVPLGQTPQQPGGKPYVYVQAPKAIGSTQLASVAPTQNVVPNSNQLQALKYQADALKPPPLPPPPIYVAPPPPAPVVQNIRPGGISLSLAAAMRMPLNLDLDGMYFENGNIVLTGNRKSDNQIDAALFLTALRASCEPGDPYFSLDADDGAVWLAEGRVFTT
jgi:hypothetical protein